jgi:hypothetical protein
MWQRPNFLMGASVWSAEFLKKNLIAFGNACIHLKSGTLTNKKGAVANKFYLSPILLFTIYSLLFTYLITDYLIT